MVRLGSPLDAMHAGPASGRRDDALRKTRAHARSRADDLSRVERAKITRRSVRKRAGCTCVFAAACGFFPALPRASSPRPVSPTVIYRAVTVVGTVAARPRYLTPLLMALVKIIRVIYAGLQSRVGLLSAPGTHLVCPVMGFYPNRR